MDLKKIFIVLLTFGISFSSHTVKSMHVHEGLKDYEVFQSHNLYLHKNNEIQLGLKIAAQHYIATHPLDEGNKLSVSIKNNLGLIKNEKNKEAIAIFEASDKLHELSFTQEAINGIKENFEILENNAYGKYKIIKFRYRDSNILPEDSDQATIFLALPYLSFVNLEKLEDNAHDSSSSRIEDFLNDNQKNALLHNKSILPYYEKIKKALKDILKHEGIAVSTVVTTDQGPLKLENLKIGDRICSRDKNTGEPQYHTVTYIDQVTLPKYIEIRFSNETLKVAHDHQLYISSLKQWVTASELQENAALRFMLNAQIKEIKEVDQPLQAIRLTVDSTHNFYVTDRKLLVHNFDPTIVITIGEAIAQVADKIVAAGVSAFLGYLAWKQNKENHPHNPIVQKNSLLENSFPPSWSIAEAINPQIFEHNRQLESQNSTDSISQEKSKENKSRKNKQKDTQTKKEGSSQQPSKKPDDKDKKNTIPILPGKMTSRQAEEEAKKLGFEKTNFYSHGQPVFKKGNRYITPDKDAHNGGMWKMADSIENLGKKSTRLGTYDQFLNKIGD